MTEKKFHISEEDIRLFFCIQKLLNDGITMHDLDSVLAELAIPKTKQSVPAPKKEGSENTPTQTEKSEPASSTTICAQLEDAMKKALAENNTRLVENIHQKVTDTTVQKLDYLLQAKERRTEEHFRKLDSALRQQTAQKEHEKISSFCKLRKLFST